MQKLQNKKKGKRTYIRWIVVGLLFIAIMFNYSDRIIWSVTAPAFSYAFHWTSSISSYGAKGAAGGSGLANYSLILFIWSLTYALFNFPGGWILDKLGLRKGIATFYAIWSVFTMLTAATFSFLSMLIVRIFMGVGEGPVWPGNAKVTKNWANKDDESKSFMFAGSGQVVGPVVAALLGVALYEAFGWRGPFIFFGAFGLLFALIWYIYVRDNPAVDKRVNKAEFDYIEKGKPKEQQNEEAVPTKQAWISSLKLIFGTQVGWGVLLTYLTYGYILYVFLYWLPPLLFSAFAHTVSSSGIYTAAIDSGAIIGFLASGPINDFLIKRYTKVNARRIGALAPMGVAAFLLFMSYFTGTAHNLVGTSILLAGADLAFFIVAGSYSLNAVDISPYGASATSYGVYNGLLNLVGAFSSLIEAALFIKYGSVFGFVFAVVFMLIFIGAYIGLIRQKTWAKAMKYRDELSKQNMQLAKANAKAKS